MKTQRIRELTLQANQVRTEHDEQMRTVLQQLEKECRRESESFDAFDDVHVAALGEFDQDQEACAFLNALYEASRANYIAGLNLLRQKSEAGNR